MAEKMCRRETEAEERNGESFYLEPTVLLICYFLLLSMTLKLFYSCREILGSPNVNQVITG